MRKEIEEKSFELTHTKPSTRKEKLIQKVIAYNKSQIRLHMLLAFTVAESENVSFIGHTNKTERSLGFFTKFETYHATDFLLLANLYRTQIIQLGKYLGFSDYLDEWMEVYPTNYKYFFDLTYHEVDRVLVRLEAGDSQQKISQETGVPLEVTTKINYYYQASEYVRSVPLIPPT